MNRKFVLLFVFTLILCSPMLSLAVGWELYDDFSSGSLDPLKWDNKSQVSTITIENQQVKIVHQAGNPNQSGYLQMVQSPENILGIRAAITITSCIGDVRTRIVGYGGKIDENQIWSALQLQPGSDRIYSSTGLEGPPPDHTWITDLHYAAFKQPLSLIGNTYTSSMIFASDRVTYEIEGLGAVAWKYPAGVYSTTNSWKAIGTRSTNGDGPCTVYVDDVYVMRP